MSDKKYAKAYKNAKTGDIFYYKDENAQAEIKNAKGTYDNLKARLDNTDEQYNTINAKFENGEIGNNVEPEENDIPRIYLSEGTLPTTKTSTTMKFEYRSKTKNIDGYVDIKCQGNSSMSYPKKNFTIKLYSDVEKTTKLKQDFKGWGKQNKFVLKANWIDLTHARNVVTARLWGDIVKSRNNYNDLSELLKTTPNQGAIDGFPILVYSNGVYQGRYTLNIPKDKWMTNMDDSLDSHCILCGENYVSGCFRASANINESDWTDELHDVVPTSIKTRWNEVISFVMNSTDDEFKSNLDNYLNVESVIDYLLFGIVSTGLDAFGKNQLYLTYDGQKWLASMYDMDSTWGLWWNGSSFVATDYSREQFEDYNGSDRNGNLLYIRLKKLFISELKARYSILRKGALSNTNILNRFEEFVNICPKDIVSEDYANTTGEGKFTGIPSKTTNNIQQLRSYIKARLSYCDEYINSLEEKQEEVVVECTGITLNNSAITFTDNSTQTLVATVTPTNTTQNIAWSVSPTGICSVNNGVITPLLNGTCTITATCGTQSATCNVTNQVQMHVTGLSLTPNILNLSLSNRNDDSDVNYLDGVTWLDGRLNSNGIIITGEDKYVEITNLPAGKYVFSSNGINYTYKKLFIINNETSYNHINSGKTSDDISIFIPNKKYKLRLSVYLNNLNFDVSKLSLKRVESLPNEYLNIDITSILSTPSWDNTDDGYFIIAPNLSQIDTFANKTFTELCQLVSNISIGDDIFDCLYISSNSIGMNEKELVVNEYPNGTLSTYQNILYVVLAIPINNKYGNTFSEFQEYLLNNNIKVKINNTTGDSFKIQENTLSATITPTNATNQNVTWASSDETVATVTVDGLNATMTGISEGTTTITCTAEDTTNGVINDSCTVTVTQ